MADIEKVNIPEEPATVFLSTPPFSSPDPATDGLRMVPVVDDGPEHPGWGDPTEAAEMKASDWVSEIENAADQDALDAVLSAYAETGKDYKTVGEAAEKKQAELDAAQGDDN